MARGTVLGVIGAGDQESGPVDTLDARDLGRLINLMARAGLRVSEAPALKIGDIELGPRSGTLRVREGKGLKQRILALSAEARASLQAYLKVRPEVNGDLLFLSRTHRKLDPRDVQRMVFEAA